MKSPIILGLLSLCYVGPSVVEIREKWGFGMAPVRTNADRKRFCSIDILLEFRSSPSLSPSTATLEAISTAKGLFTRIWKQDTWDWFTVFDRMGRPGRKQSLAISKTLKELRAYLVNKDDEPRLESELETILAKLDRLRLERCLRNYNGEWQPRSRNGQIYILSTREHRDVLKMDILNAQFGTASKKLIPRQGCSFPTELERCGLLKMPK